MGQIADERRCEAARYDEEAGCLYFSVRGVVIAVDKRAAKTLAVSWEGAVLSLRSSNT